MNLQTWAPHGEGYCGHCRFIEPLTSGGQIIEHRRGTAVYGDGGWPCPGSFKAPKKKVPTVSRASVFSLRPWVTDCPACETEVTVSARRREIRWHRPRRVTTIGPACSGTGKQVPAGAIRRREAN